MKVQVATSMNDELREKYGYRLYRSYREFRWPFELRVFNEDHGFYQNVPGLYDFLDRNLKPRDADRGTREVGLPLQE